MDAAWGDEGLIAASQAPPPAGERALVTLAAAMMAGIALGGGFPHLTIWLSLAAGGCAGAGWCWRRGLQERWVWVGLATAAMALAAAWGITHLTFTRHHDLRAYLPPPGADEARLATLTAVVATPPRIDELDRGAFARFHWGEPVTRLRVEAESIRTAEGEAAVRGGVLVRVGETGLDLAVGQRVRIQGWLSGIEPPLNPGETDFQRVMASRGVFARLSAPAAGNVEVLEAVAPSLWSGWSVLRARLAEAADRSLSAGLEDQPERLALLRALMLGIWSDELGPLQESFRKTGTSHLLAISGAHLGALLVAVWLVSRLALRNPRHPPMVVLVVLGMYLMVLPARVPIVRASIMAVLLCVGLMATRRITARSMWALAAIAVLIWRPGELFEPGFQLSFAAVWALIAYTGRVTAWLYPPPILNLHPVRYRLTRQWIVTPIAVSIVAFLATLPIIANHFGLITPLAVPLSVAGGVLLFIVLVLGFLKLLVGLVATAGGAMLWWLAAWPAAAMLALMDWASRLPWSYIELSRPAPLLWAAATAAVAAAVFHGRFARRRPAAFACAGVLAAWAWASEHPDRLPWAGPRPVALVHMVAVGDGSCFLLRLPDEDFTVLFDCGSAGYMTVGERTVVPALKWLGVKQIDLLMISHADIDHYNGVLDVLDRFPVEGILAPATLLEEALARPRSATAYLVEQVHRRGLEIEAADHHWTLQQGQASLELLWPPPGLQPARSNDGSLVLSVRVAGRRILFNGDIEAMAKEALMAAEDLRADVTDLPHHGGFVSNSPRWLEAVDPSVVLQSSGRSRLRRDRWAEVFQETPRDRLIAAREGMVEVRIAADGAIETASLRPR